MTVCTTRVSYIARALITGNKWPRGCMMMILLTLAVQPAAAQQYVGRIDMPDHTNMYGGNGMSLNPSTGRLYVPDYGNGRVLVADTRTNKALYALPASYPSGTVYDPIRNRVYVNESSSVSVWDATDDSFVRTLSRGIGTSTFGIDINPLTGRIYSVASDRVYVVDADAAPGESGLIAVVNLKDVGVYNAWTVAVNWFTNTIYVCSGYQIVVIDGATNGILTVLQHSWIPYLPSIAIDVELNRIYVPAADEVVVIDGATNQIVQGIPSPGLGMGIAVDPETHRVYLTNDDDFLTGNDLQWNINAVTHISYHAYNNGQIVFVPKELVVFDGPTGLVAGVYQMPYCQGIAVDPMTGLVYLADRGDPDSNNDVFVFEDRP